MQTVSVPLRGLDIRKQLKMQQRKSENQVSVPLRGLDIRKLPQILELETFTQAVSVPLRGLDIRKRQQISIIKLVGCRFSPLAGIRYSETSDCVSVGLPTNVSVPLRGLDIRKLLHCKLKSIFPIVSVPLRGLDIRKLLSTLVRRQKWSFSPLAGIRYSETQKMAISTGPRYQFQSPCGDQIFGNGNLSLLSKGIIAFQSPCGDQIFGNKRDNRYTTYVRFSPLAGIRYSETQILHRLRSHSLWFQSPCGDQIFGNRGYQRLQVPLRRVSVPLRGLDIRKLPSFAATAKGMGFSPLAGIRYSET